MGFLSKLFAPPPEPVPALTDPVLGQLKWSDDDEGWGGSCNGLPFTIGYDCKTHPDEGLLAYAREILKDSAWLAATLAEAKTKHKEQLSPKMRAFYEPEIDALTWEWLSFNTATKNRPNTKHFIFATLKPEKDNRSWRIEYSDRTCDGIGFDS